MGGNFMNNIEFGKEAINPGGLYGLPLSVCILSGRLCLINISRSIKFIIDCEVLLVKIVTSIQQVKWSIATTIYFLLPEGMVTCAVSHDTSSKG